jgi:hypothetical protein
MGAGGQCGRLPGNPDLSHVSVWQVTPGKMSALSTLAAPSPVGPDKLGQIGHQGQHEPIRNRDPGCHSPSR